MTKRWFPAAGLILLAGCAADRVPQSSFYEERIDPIVEFGCVQQTTGCHLASDVGEAVGNLDMSSFDALQRRDDTLPAYGPYTVGTLLLKAGPDIQIPVETLTPDPDTGEYFTTVTTDIRHAAGDLIALESAGFGELKRWIESGATRSGAPVEELAESLGSCVDGAGEAEGFDPMAPPADATSFDAFVRDVQPVLRESCSGSRCHGTEVADLYLACGDDQAELRWNYFVALDHLSTPVSTSGLLRRPLSTFRGGSFHEGGDVFRSTEDERYQAIFQWAEELVERDESLIHEDAVPPGLAYFSSRVQPALVREGCMFLGCHSPAMFHDLRLRGGSQGFFSSIATRRNYEMSLLQMAIESPDPNDSRLIAKNLFPPTQIGGGEGIPHRGGSLFEDFGGGAGPLNPASPDDCAPYDADADPIDEVPPYCIVARWLEIEREQAQMRGEINPDAEVVEALVWVSRPDGIGDVRDFDTFRGGADLRSAPVIANADGSIDLEAGESLLGSCAVAPGADIRGPAVSWDGTRIAFAARASAAAPLRLWWMNADGSGCERVPGIAPGQDMQNGILTHDFDPAFAPDGRLVFASTRGPVGVTFPYDGPTRTPAAMQPNANLYVRDADGSVRQLTFLLNQEVAPNFMADGRLIFTAEKREPEFHQLALRRQNLDGGDYHPLFAQRQSVGFLRATEVAELPDRNLVFIASNHDATDGAGTVITVNRSIGPDQDDRPTGDRAFLHSMSTPVPGAFGPIPGVPAGDRDTGAFRSPAALPTGHVVVSCDLAATDLTAGPFRFRLCDLDPKSGEIREIGGMAGQSNVEAAAIYARPDHGVFESRTDEANANTTVVEGESDAQIHILDFPLLGTLLFSNTREGRPIDDRVAGFEVFEARPPPATATSFADVSADVVTDRFGSVYVDYASLGRVPLAPDGSAKVQIPGGAPILLGLIDGAGQLLRFEPDAPFTGEMIQREQMQFYPGERANQSIPRRFFNGLCGGCHGSISGRELDIAVDVDILTSASRTMSADDLPVGLSR